jgi:hypothetical protein
LPDASDDKLTAALANASGEAVTNESEGATSAPEQIIPAASSTMYGNTRPA